MIFLEIYKTHLLRYPMSVCRRCFLFFISCITPSDLIPIACILKIISAAFRTQFVNGFTVTSATEKKRLHKTDILSKVLVTLSQRFTVYSNTRINAICHHMSKCLFCQNVITIICFIKQIWRREIVNFITTKTWSLEKT